MTTTPEVEGIEETHNTREEWESVTWNVLSNVQTGRMSLADAQDKLDAVLHHQLQKARQDIHTSLVVAVEGLKKQAPYTYDDDMCQALDNTLTIINSIFKE